YLSSRLLYFTPGWGHCTTGHLHPKLKQKLAEAPDRWIIDGNYGNRIGPIFQNQSTDIICATGPPLLLYFLQVSVRTVLGLLSLRRPCSAGCPERFIQTFFSRQSILWWSITHHFHVQRREQE
ncbi:hypothetical protein B0H13DRAFT_1458852, partial [Mycena leptocephala]